MVVGRHKSDLDKVGDTMDIIAKPNSETFLIPVCIMLVP